MQSIGVKNSLGDYIKSQKNISRLTQNQENIDLSTLLTNDWKCDYAYSNLTVEDGMVEARISFVNLSDKEKDYLMKELFGRECCIKNNDIGDIPLWTFVENRDLFQATFFVDTKTNETHSFLSYQLHFLKGTPENVRNQFEKNGVVAIDTFIRDDFLIPVKLEKCFDAIERILEKEKCYKDLDTMYSSTNFHITELTVEETNQTVLRERLENFKKNCECTEKGNEDKENDDMER